MQIRIHSLELNHNLSRYTEGRIEQKSRPPRPRLSFSARSLCELADVTIESEEGDEILAHKCILAARYRIFTIYYLGSARQIMLTQDPYLSCSYL